MSQIDVSTQMLGELTEKAFGGKISCDTILTIWHEIGSYTKMQLLQRKGVRLTSFGMFTFNSKGEPIFVMAAEFGNQFRLKQRGQPSGSSSVPVTTLNFAAVKDKANVPRDVVEKIYSKLLTCLGRVVYEGRSVLLTFHRVAEVEIQHGELNSTFRPDFISQFVNAPNPVKDLRQLRRLAEKTSNDIAVSQSIELDDAWPIEGSRTGLAIGRDEGPEKRGKARPQSAGRVRNPITGSEYSFDQGNRGGGAANGDFRRPTSAGSTASGGGRLTPRGQQQQQQLARGQQRASSAPRGQQRPSTANATQAKADQLRQARLQQSIANQTDARRIAAKALANDEIINKVRAKIVERGGSNGIRSITKLLSIMDDNGDKRLNRDELRFGLRDYGIDLSPTELEQVFLYFDRDNNGFIDVTEFLVGIRGEMNARRRSMVQMAFDILDKDRSGVVDANEILAVYDLNWHPEVRAGRMTLQEAAKQFMATWDRKDHDGQVTLDEFEDYYKEISASIDDDDYFELMIRNAWRIAGGEGMAANTANRRVLVTNKDGSQSVATVQNELGMRGRDVEDVRRRLAGQGIDAAEVALYGGYEDKRGNPRGAAPARLVAGRPAAPAAGGRPSAAPAGPAGGGRKEAWVEKRGTNYDMLMQAPVPGDQNLPDQYHDEGYSYGRQQQGRPTGGRPSSAGARNGVAPTAGPRPSSGGTNGQRGAVGGTGAAGPEDIFAVMKRLLYTPPVNLEGLCIKLQASAAGYTPRIAQGAFIKRMQTLDPTLSKEQLQGMWRAIDPRNAGSSEVSVIHDLLSNRFGKDKTAAKSSSVLDRVKIKILERCGQNAGIKGLARTLMIMDDSGDKKLSKEELKHGLADYGITLNLREIDEVFGLFDRDKNGFIDIDELLVGIRGDLNERRQRLVDMVFNMLDRDGSGEITIDEMLDRFDFTQHPEVKEGKKTAREAMKDFIRTWDRADGDGIVTHDEFCDYYKEVSASVDGDDYFELMIRNAWRIAGGEGMAANTANRRVLVTNKDGSQSVATVQNELGMRGRDVEDVRRRLAGQGIDAAEVALYGGYEDKRGSSANGRRGGGMNKTMDPGLASRLQQKQRPVPGKVVVPDCLNVMQLHQS
eukprot:gene3086-2262_t